MKAGAFQAKWLLALTPAKPCHMNPQAPTAECGYGVVEIEDCFEVVCFNSNIPTKSFKQTSSICYLSIKLPLLLQDLLLKKPKPKAEVDCPTPADMPAPSAPTSTTRISADYTQRLDGLGADDGDLDFAGLKGKSFSHHQHLQLQHGL